jgi:hypothetical protein
MRCGTTTLWELLDRHEQVFLPRTKELHFFDDRDGGFAGGLATYATHFQSASPDAVCGEFSPSYMFVPGTAERIKRVLPKVRLIAILRDPVERAWSHYWFNVRAGREWLSFDKAIESEHKRLTNADQRRRNWFGYVAVGHYVEQLLEYEKLFSREQLLIVLFEDLSTDPEATMRGVFEHIGVDPIVDSRSQVPWRNRGQRPRWKKTHYLSAQARSWSNDRGALTRTLAPRDPRARVYDRINADVLEDALSGLPSGAIGSF